MRSRAQFRGHPIHPSLIPFPFAFLYGAVVADLLGTLLDHPALWTTGYHLALAGVIMGVIAAVPGAIDYRYTVPPQSSGKRRALKHALLNLSAVALFALAWLVRGAAAIPPDPAVLLLEVLAAGLLTAGGWMGGTLVYRNQISVDHRYARAGKWREVSVKPRPGEPVVVAAADELEVDQMKLVRTPDRRIVLARTEAGYVAFDDRCPHRGGSLAGGTMACGVVTCPWHGSQFETGTGAVRAGPADEPISTYRVEQAGDRIHLVL